MTSVISARPLAFSAPVNMAPGRSSRRGDVRAVEVLRALLSQPHGPVARYRRQATCIEVEIGGVSRMEVFLHEERLID